MPKPKLKLKRAKKTQPSPHHMIDHALAAPCAAFCFEPWIVGGYLMIVSGSLIVCFGYQNCSPRNCVAPSTVMNGADSSSMLKELQ
jgi:hypothetical protein